MSAYPLVSVIMPAYNAALHIEDALESIFYQDYPAIEVIVANDGSQDNTLEILKKYEDRIHIIDKDNEGSATARNAAIRIARGKYLAFLDSDDIWLPGKISAQIHYMEKNPSAGVTYGLFDHFFETPDNRLNIQKIQDEYGKMNDKDEVETIESSSGWVYRKFLFDSLSHTITVVMKKDLVDSVGYFDPQLRRGQDYDYWIRLSRITEFHKLDYKMALYRHHGENITAKCMPVNSERVVVEKAIKTWGYTDIDGSRINKKALDRRLSDLSFDFAYMHYWHGDTDLAKIEFLDSVRLSPLRLKAWAYLTLSVFAGLRSFRQPLNKFQEPR